MAQEALSSPHFDVCILCAMADEARMFQEVARKLGASEFRPAFSSAHLQYYHATINNDRGEPLSLQVSWQTNYGPLEAGLHIERTLNEFKPRFAGMTGLCAGDRDKVALGDIVVAEKAFFCDTGKFTQDAENPYQEYATETRFPPPAVLHFVRGFDGWKSGVAGLKRPVSRRQQRDWLLTTLLEETTASIDRIGLQNLDRYAPDWRKIVQALQKEPAAFLTSSRALQNAARVYDLYYGAEVFPYKDPATPRVHIVPIASSSAVRADRPFEHIRIPVRHTAAIDMEGASFYHTAASFPETLFLLVKGVADYADSEKDDSYQEYAAAVSAAYMLRLIQEYVTPASQQQATMEIVEVAAAKTTPTVRPYTPPVRVERSAVEPPEGVINLFYAYAPEDEGLRRKLEIHLKILQRLGYIAELYGEHRVDVGMDEEQEMQRQLASSKIIVLLISPYFMASERCNTYMNQALNRQQRGKARIVPILLRPTYLGEAPVSKLRALPTNNQAITTWRELDTVFSEIAREIRTLINQLRGQP
ncbi:MAG TPA: TIR domain-containing protein [Ktedonobacteraceae bacterium]|jgi:nucleoside phosphorylase